MNKNEKKRYELKILVCIIIFNLFPGSQYLKIFQLYKN